MKSSKITASILFVSCVTMVFSGLISALSNKSYPVKIFYTSSVEEEIVTEKAEIADKDVDSLSSENLESDEEEVANFPIDLNQITYEELLQIPGIGHVTATRILQYRNELGGYSSLEELLDIKGIGDATLEKLKSYVFI